MPVGEKLWTEPAWPLNTQLIITPQKQMRLIQEQGSAVPFIDQQSFTEGSLDDSALDVQHLSRQTFGDAELEREILALFREQCAKLEPVIAGHSQLPSRVDAAHTLKGGARAVGAVAVASIADEIERALRHHGELARGQIEKLSDCIVEIRRAIDLRLTCDS